MPQRLAQVYACWNPQQYPVGTIMRFTSTAVWRTKRIGSVFGRRYVWNGLTRTVHVYRYFTLEEDPHASTTD